MNKLTKIISAFALVLSLATTTALATTEYFSFELNPGDLDYTGYYSKDDSEKKAYINTTDGNFVSTDKVWYKVRNRANTKYTNSKWVNSEGKITLNYRQSVSSGGAYRLNAQQDDSSSQGVWVEGRWTP
ncbi:hypothetical protein [Clostridium minihomine]|uniref:hypothetical protein n=1 Tax=Clostridium minihomine TaxID=2045012 RepID=UPI000C76EEAC|nr:hypothetical protein [Clostridium minihomine]